MRALVASLAIAGTAACGSSYPPRPAGPVLDLAGVIEQPLEQALDARLRGFYERTCRAVVVATVPSLGGKTVEAYATGLANRWGIGDAKRDDGVLVLVAPTERKVRIEVGTGLAGTLTNAAAATIIQQDMLPSYRTQRYSAGIDRGVAAIVRQLEVQPVQGGCAQRKAA